MKKLLLVTTALVALSAAPAHAGPIGAAIAWVGTTLAAGGFAAAALQTAIGIGASLLSTALAGQPKQKVSVTFDVEMGDDLPLSFVVGDYVTAGKRKHIGSWGADSRFITEVIEVSALPQGLDGVWVNDEEGEFAAGRIGHVSDTATGWYYDHLENIAEDAGLPAGRISVGTPLTNYGDDGNRIWVKWMDGTQTAADPLLLRIFGGDADYPWTAEMIGAGKSYAIVTTRYDSDTLTSYPSFLWKPEPLPLYDLRKDSSAGGSGAHRWGERATYEPSTNPAIIGYNVARGIYYGGEWLFGGKNLSAWRLPAAEWMAAANAHDDAVSTAAGGTEPRHRAGAEITVDMVAADVLEEIGRASNMRFAEVGGRLKPIVGLPGSSVLAFTDATVIITEGQSFKPFEPLSSTYNAISATYPEPGEKWTNRDAPEYVDADLTAGDGGRYLPTSVDYAAAPYKRQVQRLMRAQLKDYRRTRVHQFYLPPEAYALEPGDMLSWTSARNGYSNKKFIAEKVAKAPNMNVLVTLREADPSDYDWSSAWEVPVTITPPKNVRPFTQTINGLTVTAATIKDGAGSDRVPAILVACAGTELGIRSIRIQGRLAGGTVATIDTTRPWGDPWAWYLQNVLPATSYQVRAQLVSERTNRSQWSAWLTVETPDVRLGDLDIRFDEITQEVIADVAALDAWSAGTGDYLRGLRAEIAAVRDSIAELDGATWLAQDTIQRGAAVALEGARAEYTERIDVNVSETLAIASKLETLVAVVDGNKAEYTQLIQTAVDETRSVAASLDSLTANFDGKVSNVIIDHLAQAGMGGTLTYYANRVNAAIGLGKSAGASNTLLSRMDVTEAGIVAAGEAITEANAKVGRINANGLLRISATAAPEGSQTRIAFRAEASAEDTSHAAAMFLEASSDGKSQVIFMVDRLAVVGTSDPKGNRWVPFVIDAGAVYMNNAFIRNASITRAKIGNNEIYADYFFEASDVEITTARLKANPVLLMSQTITGFEGGGFIASFSAYADNTSHLDSFGTVYMVINGVTRDRQRFGVRSDGGGVKYIIPISLTGTASAGSSVNIQIYGYNSHWDSDTAGSNTFSVVNMSLTVSGARR
jgi:hypothetical protein